MRKSELFDRCVFQVEELLKKRKLRLLTRQKQVAQHYFTSNYGIHSGISVSTVETEVGFITRAWAFVFVDVDHPLRCSEIHTSYYGESVALGKLWVELERLGNDRCLYV